MSGQHARFGMGCGVQRCLGYFHQFTTFEVNHTHFSSLKWRSGGDAECIGKWSGGGRGGARAGGEGG